jgi:hypothetical protein
MRAAVFFLSALLVVGCGKDRGNTQPSTPGSSPKPQGNRGQGNTAPTNLQVYEGANPALNKIQAAHVSQGQAHFDFVYQPQRDEGVTLTSLKSYLIGCQDSDNGLNFMLFRFGPDGQVDFSSYEQLGPAPAFENGPFPAPVLVKRHVKYLLRVDLRLRKDCLGFAYYFGVRSTR